LVTEWTRCCHAKELMAFVPAKSLAELLIKAWVARPYIERTDDKLPADPRDRLWLSIADDIEQLAKGGAA
jgi:hypothetical protein